MQGYNELARRGRGYVATMPDGSNLFVGRNSQLRDTQDIWNGNTRSSLTPEQLADNRANYLQRMQEGRQQRMQNVTALAQQRAAERNLSPLQRMMASDPRFLAMQQQQAHQLALQNAENAGRVQVAGIEAGANQQRNMLGGLAALVNAGMPAEQALRVVAAQQGGNAGGLAGLQLNPQGQPGQGIDPTKKIHFGGKVSENELKELHAIKERGGDRRELVAALQAHGLKGKELDEALNQVLGTWWRTAQNPNFWGGVGNMLAPPRAAGGNIKKKN